MDPILIITYTLAATRAARKLLGDGTGAAVQPRSVLVLLILKGTRL